MSTLSADFNAAVAHLKSLSPEDTVAFILRHAESAGQKKPEQYKTPGDSNIPLTPRGVRQGNAAGKLIWHLGMKAGLRDIHIFSSTGLRSTSTTLEIYDTSPRKRYQFVNFDPRLDKEKFGDFDGLFTKAERRAAHPKAFIAFQRQVERQGLFYARPPHGESIADVQDRMQPFWEEKTALRKPLVVVTHGTNALCLEDLALNHGVPWIMENIDTRPNCAIRMITGHAGNGFEAKTICADPVKMANALKL